jgi:electron transport complex protein RnfB
MPLTSSALWVPVAFVAACGSGLLVGRALRERLDASDPPAFLRGKPLLLLTAMLAAVPFAAIGGEHLGWICWLAASAGWAIALLRSESTRNTLSREELVAAIDRVLPQTQCSQCGYPGCRPYAAAIANGEADINQCPPGGAAGVRKLADLLGRTPKPLNPENGIEKSKVVALIVEADCIGCTKCIQACPVDAIVGAPRRMHTVIADLCTGCELCLPPCPVDCIVLQPAPTTPRLTVIRLAEAG